MNSLETLYNLYLSSGTWDELEDTPEVIVAFNGVTTQLSTLDSEAYKQLDKLICDYGIAYEKQGFMRGFRLAVRLMAECMGKAGVQA